MNEIYDKEVPGALWSVRYFRDGSRKNTRWSCSPNGAAAFCASHFERRSARGFAEQRCKRVKRAEDYLRNTKHIDLSQWSLIESKSDKHPHRVDHP